MTLKDRLLRRIEFDGNEASISCEGPPMFQDGFEVGALWENNRLRPLLLALVDCVAVMEIDPNNVECSDMRAALAAVEAMLGEER